MNLHCRAAISNCEFLELLYPISYMDFGMKRAIDIDAHRYAHAPDAPGIGGDWDWVFIDNCTIKVQQRLHLTGEEAIRPLPRDQVWAKVR